MSLLPKACCPNDKWSSGCQDVSFCCRRDLKNISPAVESRVCTSCGMIPTWQQKKKSEHNCSVSNKLKCSRRLHQLTHLLFFLFFLFSTVAFLCLPNVWCGSKEKHWSPLLIADAKPDIRLTGCGPVLFFFRPKCFCMFAEDGWTMCFWANKNVAHKSLPGHRGSGEIVCKRIIVTPMTF